MISILDGEVLWIAQCHTRRGAERSKAYMQKHYPSRKNWQYRIVSVEDLLRWDDSGLRELEAMYKL